MAVLLAPAAAVGQQRPPLALMGTIPLYWGEADGLADLLSGAGALHWARAELERGWQLVPLDYLSSAALSSHRHLLLAQPRGLTGEENVALDGWVRGGGQLLLFADPLLTGESRYAIGDRRRPQDVALLSPILAHWGLELRFAEQPDAAPQLRALGDLALPVEQPGQLALIGPHAPCHLLGEGLVAACRLGAGRALIVADAALLDLHHRPQGACAALHGLLAGSLRDLEPLSATGDLRSRGTHGFTCRKYALQRR